MLGFILHTPAVCNISYVVWITLHCPLLSYLSGPVAFKSMNGNSQSDEHFLLQLKSAAAPGADAPAADTASPSRRRGSKATNATAMAASALTKLQLRESDVAKMTKDAVTCMAFHPTTTNLIIAAADKQGKVSEGSDDSGKARWSVNQSLRI